MLVRQCPPRIARVGRLRQDLVVDIGNVGDDSDVVPLVAHPAPEYVEDHLFTDVANVRGRLHGQPAVIDPDLPRIHRDEVADLTCGGVVEANTHPASLSILASYAVVEQATIS